MTCLWNSKWNYGFKNITVTEPEHECVREPVAFSGASVYSKKICHIPDVLAKQEYLT